MFTQHAWCILHSCAQYRHYGIRKNYHAPVHASCMQLALLLYSCIWHGTGITWISHMPQAYCTLQQTLVSLKALTPGPIYMSYIPASVVHRIPMGFMLKSVHWPIGQDSGPKVQKSALTSGTTAQLAVLAECALEQMHIYDWVEGSISGRLPFLTTARNVSINYYDNNTFAHSIVYNIYSYQLLLSLYCIWNIMLFYFSLPLPPNIISFYNFYNSRV